MAPLAAPQAAPSSNSGAVIGGILGGLILIVAVSACAFPYFRNWVLARRGAKLGNKKSHLRKLSLLDKIGAPLLVKSPMGHSRDDSYASMTSSYYMGDYNNEQTHADNSPLMRQTDDLLPTHDERHALNNYKMPFGRPRLSPRSDTNTSFGSAYSSHSIPPPKPPPSQPLPPVPLNSKPRSVKRKASPKEDATTQPIERSDTYAVSRMIKTRVERGGHATPLRQPTDFSIIESSESVGPPPVPALSFPPVPKLPIIPAASPSRQIRPLPQPRNKSLRLPTAPMEPLMEMDLPPSAVSEVFPEPAAQTWKELEVRLEAPPSAGLYTPLLTASSPEEATPERPLTDAFRKSTLPSPTNDVAPRYPSLGAYPIIPPNSAPLTSEQASAFPSTARYSAFPMTAVPPDSAYPFSATLAPEYALPRNSAFPTTAAFPSSVGFPSPETPTQWAESIIDAYGTSMSRFTWDEYATTAPLRLASAGRTPSRTATVRGARPQDGTGRGTARKKPRLEVMTEFDDASVYSGTRSGSTGTERGPSTGTPSTAARADSTDVVPVDSVQTARIREVDVKSTRQGLQERPRGVGQSFQARTFI